MKTKGKVWIVTGLLLIAAALFLTAYNFYDGFRAERSARQVMQELMEYFPAETAMEKPVLPGETSVSAGEREIPDYVLNPDMEMPETAISGIGYIGVLRIPSLQLELPVIGEWSYPNLKIAPCRYSGSPYSGSFIIAGHNYRSHFGGLQKLREGDAVTFTDMDGNVFSYAVAEWEVLPSAAIEEMESGDWPLTLFTCTVSGQSRLSIRCTLAETEEPANAK